MSFLLRIIIALVIYFGIQFYFVKKSSFIIRTIFPTLKFTKFKFIRTVSFLFLNIFPVSLILLWSYYYFTNDRSLTAPEGPAIDYLVIYPFWFYFTFVLQIFIFYLTSDLIKLFLFPLFRKIKNKWRLIEARVLFIIFAIFFIYTPTRIIYDLSTIEIREVDYKKEKLHSDLQGFKIALISDVQVDRYTNGKRLEEFISKVNGSKPDLILIAGDIITSSPRFINSAAGYLGNLESKYGVFACIGDHDNWAYRGNSDRSIKEVTDALAKYNIPMIDNEKRILKIGNAEIGITFLTNTYVERISSKLLDSLTNGNIKYDLKIFLTHQPRNHLIEKAIEYNYDFYFAGHTHGGQITLLYPFFNLSPTLIETNYVRGDFWFNNMLMVITPGLGLSLAPIRYNSTPEVTIIKLGLK